MPTYDYRCDATGEVFEVKHRMNEVLNTWRELCQLAEIDLGGIAPESPVTRLATGGQIVKRSSLGDDDRPTCGAGACGRGMCGIN